MSLLSCVRTAKTLTTPHDLSSCFFDGLNQLAELAYGEGDVVRLLQETDYVRYSTTQGTNALVQRSGPRVGLIVLDQDHAQALRVGERASALFDSVVTLGDCLRAFADMIPAMEANETRMRQAALAGFSTATDLADYLVNQGVPFRDAHHLVGEAWA